MWLKLNVLLCICPDYHFIYLTYCKTSNKKTQLLLFDMLNVAHIPCTDALVIRARLHHSSTPVLRTVYRPVLLPILNHNIHLFQSSIHLKWHNIFIHDTKSIQTMLLASPSSHNHLIQKTLWQVGRESRGQSCCQR